MKHSMVSVIIPTFRRPVFLSRALDSVLSSTYDNYEIIVVDDNNDGDEYREETEQIMQPYVNNYKQLKYLKHKNNRNGSAARNTGIKEASGDYYMFLDDDDVVFPNKMAAQVEFLDSAKSDYGACYTNYVDVMKNGKLRNGTEKAEGNLLAMELARNLFIHAGSNLMVRESVVKEVNGFDETFLRNQDVEFLVKILRKYKLGHVDVVGLKVYIHERTETDFDLLTMKFINTFQKDIDLLSKEEQQFVYKMLALQRARNAISKRDMGRIKTLIRNKQISISDLIKYYAYLANRLIRNESYGYPMMTEKRN